MQKREPLIHFKRGLCFLKLTGKSNLKVRKSYSSGSQILLLSITYQPFSQLLSLESAASSKFRVIGHWIVACSPHTR